MGGFLQILLFIWYGLFLTRAKEVPHIEAISAIVTLVVVHTEE